MVELTTVRNVLLPLRGEISAAAGGVPALFGDAGKIQIHILRVLRPGENETALPPQWWRITMRSNVSFILRTGDLLRETVACVRQHSIDLVLVPAGLLAEDPSLPALLTAAVDVPVLVLPPGYPGSSGSPRKRARKGATTMETQEPYVEEIRARICSRCIDSTAEGICTAATYDVCPLNLFLPRIIRTVLSTGSDDADVHVANLRREVCSECRHQNSAGVCSLRDELECPLDRYYPLVVEAIGHVRRRQ